MLAVYIIGGAVYTAPEFESLSKHIISGSTFYSNFQLFKEVGYFDTSSENKPLLHLWSLSVEEQFYLIWPLIILTASKKWPLYLLFSISIVLSLTLSRSSPELAFYMLPSRFWELVAGAVLAVSQAAASAFSKTPLKNLPILRFFGLIPLAAIAYSASNFNGLDGHTWVASLIAVVCSVTIIALGESDRAIKFFLGNKLAVFIGLISYPLYLWHWPLLSFLKSIQDDIGFTINEVRVIRFSIVILSVMLAYLTYRWIEIPVKKLVDRLSLAGYNKKGILLFFCSLLLLLSALGATTVYLNGLPQRHLVGENYDLNAREVSEISLKSELAKLGVCHRKADFKLSELDWCFQQGADPTVAVIGDSHARALYLGLAQSMGNLSSILIARGACPPAIFVTETGIDTFDRCISENKSNFNFIINDTNIKTVILVAYGVSYTDGGVFGNVIRGGVLHHAQKTMIESTGLKQRRQALFDGIDAAVTALSDAGKKIVFVIDVPELGFNPSDCVHGRPYRQKLRSECYVNKEAVVERQQGYRALIGELKAKHPELMLFDSLPILCDQIKCYGGRGGHMYYHDDNHLGVYGSSLVGQRLSEYLKSIR